MRFVSRYGSRVADACQKRRHGDDTAANDTEAQLATGVVIVPDPGSDGACGWVDVIRVKPGFSDTVHVTGAPRLNITAASGHGARWAVYEAGCGTAAPTFAFPAVEPNHTREGIALPADTLELNGGTIRAAADLNAGLSHPGPGRDPDHRADWRD